MKKRFEGRIRIGKTHRRCTGCTSYLVSDYWQVDDLSGWDVAFVFAAQKLGSNTVLQIQAKRNGSSAPPDAEVKGKIIIDQRIKAWGTPVKLQTTIVSADYKYVDGSRVWDPRKDVVDYYFWGDDSQVSYVKKQISTHDKIMPRYTDSNIEKQKKEVSPDFEDLVGVLLSYNKASESITIEMKGPEARRDTYEAN